MNKIETPWGETGYITYKRTYARRLKDIGEETEEFKDTVERVIRACDKQLKVGFSSEEENRLREILLSLKGIVAGRFLWQLGTKTVDSLGLASLQNCATTLVNEPVRPFTWAMDMLMLGSGVGYNIQREYVYELPKAKRVKIVRQDTKDADFIVPDTRAGWVELLERTLQAHFYTGKGFTYSTVCIRGKGTPIKGFGGIASGPEELCWGIENISKVINNRGGKKLRPIDCLDIMNIIGFIVVAGNVRRSAQIAIGDMDDLQYLNAKRWDLGNIPNWRAMSNNSIVCNDINLLPEQFWQGYNGNGEPYGMINLNLARSMGRIGETQYPDPDVIGFNPCFSPETLITTDQGLYPIEDLVGKNVKVLSNNKWVEISNFRITGKDQRILKLVMQDGSELRVTPYHSMILSDGTRMEAQFIKPGDSLLLSEYVSHGEIKAKGAYIKGFLCGDGNITAEDRPTLYLYPPKFSCKDRLVSSAREIENGAVNTNAYSDLGFVEQVSKGKMRNAMTGLTPKKDELKDWCSINKQRLPKEVFAWNKESKEQFIAGLFDADGTASDTKNGYMYQLSSTHKQFLLDVQTLLKTIGVYSKLSSMHESGSRNFNDGYGEYECKESWRLTVSQESAIVLSSSVKFSRLSTFENKTTTYKIKSKRNKVVEIYEDGKEELVYCCTVPETHSLTIGIGLEVGQCAEQSLADKETCCLAEIYLPNIASKEELLEVSKYLYRINKHSLSLPCHHPETQAIVHKNMRMGIGVTGYLQATEEQRGWLADTYTQLREFDKEYSAKHNWPTSVKLTTVKPSGCSVGNSLIFTEQGILRLDEMVNTTGSEWQDINYSTTDGHKISKGFINGFVPTKKITTADGFVFESSLNHKYLVNDGEWKTVNDLTVSDKFRVQLGTYNKKTESNFSFISESHVTNTNQIIQPEKMNTDLAFFFGLLAADGSTHSKGIRISFNRRDNDLIVLLKDIIKNNFGLEGTIDEDHGFYVNSVQLLRWLEKNGLSKNYCDQLSVPKVIRTSSVDSIKSYIAGFWRGDGGQHNISSWSLCSVSHSFIQEIATLCRAVGYNPSIKSAGPGGYGKLDRKILLNRDSKPNRYQSNDFKNRFFDNSIWLDPIVSIEESHNHTYDVSVDHEDHKYLLAGAESHNTLSLLAGVTPGVHPGYSQHFIRRIRMASNSNLVNLCRENGYHVEYQRNFDGSEDKNTVVVSFPCKYPDGTVVAKDVTAIDQMNFVKELQTKWSDNAVSCTVYYKKEELSAIKEWLKNNYNNNVKTVSFLLHNDHGFDQAPYEEITKEKYEELVAKTKPITAVEVKESDLLDSTECLTGACPVK